MSSKLPDDTDAIGPKDQVLKSTGFTVRSGEEMNAIDVEFIETLRGCQSSQA